MIVSAIEHLTTPLFLYLQTKDIIIYPLTEYLSNDINQCGATSCHTCKIFINDQSFESNLTGREYKTISYDRLSCGSTNVIYGIHCVHCGLVYAGETGRSLRSRMNGHRSSAEYRVIAIILDIANFRLFRPVRSDVPAETPKHFMKIKFLNKAVDAINLPALLRSTSVTNKIPVYFRDTEPPIVSYEYTSTVASKLFNFSPALSNLNVSEYFFNPQTCQCKESKFCYEPHGHVITGDLRVIENAKLRELVAKGPEYKEPNRVNWKATETMFLESIDLYAKNWSKREQVELKYLSEWKDQLKELVADRISDLKGHFKSPKCKVLDQPYVKDTLHKLHANYVLVPADKAANNMIIVCKKYYIDTLVKELGINNVNINNPTYIPIDDSFKTIMKSHNQFITSVGLEISEEDQNLPYLYWTPKLHKSPYKHRFIAGSSKCTTKDLSCLLTKVLSTIKDGLVRYCNTKTSHNGVNNMWILKNSTSLLSSLDQLDVRTATSVQTFDFSTLYTSVPHDLLKSRISNLVHNAFRKKDGSVRYTHIKVTRAKGYFTHDINSGGDNMYTFLCSLEGVFSVM